MCVTLVLNMEDLLLKTPFFLYSLFTTLSFERIKYLWHKNKAIQLIEGENVERFQVINF